MVDEEKEKRVQRQKVAGWLQGRSMSLLEAAHVMPDSVSSRVGVAVKERRAGALGVEETVSMSQPNGER